MKTASLMNATGPEPLAQQVGPCPCCQGNAFEPARKAAKWGLYSIVRCKGCGLGVTTPPPTPAEIASFYPPSHYGSGGPRFRPLIEKVAIWLRHRRAAWIHRMRPPGRALEVGCGHGYLLAGLRDRGWTVEGVELHDVAATFGRKVLGLPISVGELPAMEYATSSFDVVVFWQSFEHFANPLETLEEVARILKPGGLAIVSVPNSGSWQSRWSGDAWFHWEVPRHLHHYDVETLTMLFSRVGLDVQQVSHANWEQNPFGWVQSMLNRWGQPDNHFFDGLYAKPTRERRAIRSLERLMALALGPVGVLLAIAETLARRGGTMTLVGKLPAE